MVRKVLNSKLYGKLYGKLTDTYAYNVLDQLSGYTGYDGYNQQFTFDANGMRLTKAEAGNGERSTLEELLRGNIAGLPEIVAPAETQTNEDGAAVPAELEWATTEYLYDITYNAEMYDAATGMINLRARQYEPTMNRFNQKDIVQGLLTSPLLLHRFLYTKNAPVSFGDASGEFLNAIVNGIKSAVNTVKNAVKEVKSIAKSGKTTKGESVKQIANRLLTGAYNGIKSVSTKMTEEMNLYLRKKQRELDDLGTLTAKNIGAANRILMSMCSVLLEKERYGNDFYTDYIGNDLYMDRLSWGALPRNNDDMKPIDGSINSYFDTVVIHHTDVPQGASPVDVQKEHLNRNLSDTGYHFIIDVNGVVYEGRELELVGAHVNSGNTGKIGIVLTGNFQANQPFGDTIKNLFQGAMPTQPTQAQIESLKQLTNALSDAYGIESVGGHRDYVKEGMAEYGTSCPGDSLYEILIEEKIIK